MNYVLQLRRLASDLTKTRGTIRTLSTINLKTRGYGIEISGSEKAKRRAMSYVIAKSLKEDEFLSLFKDSVQKKSTVQENSVSERLLHLVDQRKLLIIEDVMEELNRLLPFSITDNAYVGLIVHLALAIERIMLGENIQMDTDLFETVKIGTRISNRTKNYHRINGPFQD